MDFYISYKAKGSNLTDHVGPFYDAEEAKFYALRNGLPTEAIIALDKAPELSMTPEQHQAYCLEMLLDPHMV